MIRTIWYRGAEDHRVEHQNRPGDGGQPTGYHGEEIRLAHGRQMWANQERRPDHWNIQR